MRRTNSVPLRRWVLWEINLSPFPCFFTRRPGERRREAVVLVTVRFPEERLFRELRARHGDWVAGGIRSVRVIGDACAP